MILEKPQFIKTSKTTFLSLYDRILRITFFDNKQAIFHIFVKIQLQITTKYQTDPHAIHLKLIISLSHSR